MNNNGVSLLNVVMMQMKCTEERELNDLDKYQKKYLAKAIDGVRDDSASLSEWNELLCALGSNPKQDCHNAKKSVIRILSM